MDKLINILDKHPDMTKREMNQWITQRWEPAHNIELATKDVEDSVDGFDWFNNHIRVVNEATEVLKIGKGLQQTMEASEDLSVKLYKLRTLSTTRFSAYFESSLTNFERNIEIIIKALQVRAESKEKKVRDIAIDLLKQIVNKQFLATHLGLIDIYRMLGIFSSKLQEVEQFPWEVTEKLEAVVNTLRSMSEFDITSLDIKAAIEGLDANDWPKVKEGLEKILKEEYISTVTPLLYEHRRGRSLGDVGDKNILKTVENRLTSVTKYLADRIENRALYNEECPVSEVIKLSGECFDLKNILQHERDEDSHEEFERLTVQKLTKLLRMAGHRESKREVIIDEYKTFKQRLVLLVDDEMNEVLRKFSHILLEEHKCCETCVKPCSNKGTPAEPKEIRPMKILHLFLKEKDLYTGIENFLHFFLRVTMKTHAEGVAESMGNLIDIHSEKRRGMELTKVGVEAQIDWNGPPLHMVDKLGEKALDKIFGGRSRWHFVTNENKEDSVVTKRLKEEKPSIPFFC